jgi:hypothetical protein
MLSSESNNNLNSSLIIIDAEIKKKNEKSK